IAFGTATPALEKRFLLANLSNANLLASGPLPV
ncbi:unnamed protein product, partial [marine sediment metagenome]